MTEIRIDVHLPHPPERVWRAVTDPRILSEWFLAADLRPVRGARFTMEPRGQVGFDDEPISGEVVDVEAPTRLVMRWRATQLQTVVTLSVQPVGDGCRLALAQHGFVGPRGTLRRRVLQRSYAEMFGAPLCAALDRLADTERDRAAQARRRGGSVRTVDGPPRRNESRSFGHRSSEVGLGRAHHPGTVANGLSPDEPTLTLAPFSLHRRGAHGRRTRLSVLAGWPRPPVAVGVVLLVLIATGTLVLGRALAPTTRAANASVAAPSARVAPGPGSGAASRPSGAAVTVSAVYRTGRASVGGYQGIVTINNLSSVPMDGWTAIVTLPLGLIVHDPRGAEYQQTGKEVRFTPAPGTRVVAPGTSMEFSFEVQGAGAPVGCTVNARPCAGIPG